MPHTKPCAIWCGRAKRRRKISSATGTDWGNFLLRHGKRPTDAGKAGPKVFELDPDSRAFRGARLAATLAHYREEVEPHRRADAKLEQAIDEP